MLIVQCLHGTSHDNEDYIQLLLLDPINICNVALQKKLTAKTQASAFASEIKLSTEQCVFLIQELMQHGLQILLWSYYSGYQGDIFDTMNNDRDLPLITIRVTFTFFHAICGGWDWIQFGGWEFKPWHADVNVRNIWQARHVPFQIVPRRSITNQDPEPTPCSAFAKQKNSAKI